MISKQIKETYNKKTKEAIELSKQADKLLKDYIDDYVDEGEMSNPHSPLSFTARGFTYQMWRFDVSVTNLQSECIATMPTTEEDMLKMFNDKKIANRCAVQALMAYKYIED